MISEVINGVKNLVNGGLMVLDYIMETLYWLPVSQDEIKRIIVIGIVIGVLLTGIDFLFFHNNDEPSGYFASAYWGAALAFISSIVGLSVFFSLFGEITENDLNLMLPLSFGISGCMALVFGISAFLHPENAIMGMLSFIVAIPLWVCIAYIIVVIYLLKQGEIMQALGCCFFVAIPGIVLSAESEYILIIFED